MGESDRAQTLVSAPSEPSSREAYREVARVFFKLGVFGFGGPVAVMAMMEEEAVRRHGWLTPAEFGEMYAVCKLLPGPVATQMGIYLGTLRGGIRGGLLSGGLFILPSFVLVLGLSMLYADTGVAHGAEAILAGLQAAALAIIVVSTWGLGKPYRRDLRAWFIVAVSALVIFCHSRYEPGVILGFGLIGVLKAKRATRLAVVGTVLSGTFLSARQAAAASLSATWATISALPAHPKVLFDLFWMCFKAGFLVFGTGLAVVPVLEGEAVGQFHWLTHSQFMDGLALGQVTPGPVVITSTFIGYLAAKLPGAVAATVGMFLPPFINVLFLVPRVWRRFSGTPGARGFTAWAIPAVIGGILGTTLKLGLLTLLGWQAVLLFAASLAASVWLKPPAWLLIPLTGVAGALLGH